MPRILQNLRERAIGLLNAGMAMNAVAMNIGCSTRAVRLLMHFQATGPSEARSHSGRLRVATRRQDRYILNTHLHSRFQTATATASNTHGTHNNCRSAQTVHNCLREGGQSALAVHVLVVFWCDVTV